MAILEIDHLLICVPEGFKAAEIAENAGLQRGLTRAHKGQGTQNACYFFENAYLEFLWVRDERELVSEAVKPLGLAERMRWRETGACPVGAAFRFAIGIPKIIPVDTWPYQAPFLREGKNIPVITKPHRPEDPLISMSPNWYKKTILPPAPPAQLLHLGKPRKLTAVEITMPASYLPSPEIAWCHDHGFLQIEEGDACRLTIEWNNREEGRTLDLTPAIPLTIHY